MFALQHKLKQRRLAQSYDEEDELYEFLFNTELVRTLLLAEFIPIPRIVQSRRDITLMTDEACLYEFRFTFAEIRLLSLQLCIPDPFTTRTNSLPASYALCLLLSRLSGTRSQRDVANAFHTSQSVVSLITNALVQFMVDRWGGLTRFNRSRVSAMLPQYAAAVRSKGAALDSCIGFIDGTNREMCRPSCEQGVFYSGHKHYHSFKF